MRRTEFDGFADAYQHLQASTIRASGESPEYFAEYTVADLAQLLTTQHEPADIGGLDFGCRVGSSTHFFGKYLPHTNVVSLDVSSASPEIAMDRFSGRCICCEGQTIFLTDNSFDFVFSACAFRPVPPASQGPLLSEILRVRKKGHLSAIFEHYPSNTPTVRAVNDSPFDENAVLISPRVVSSRLTETGFFSAGHRYRIFFPHAQRAMHPVEPLLRSMPLGPQHYVSAYKQVSP